MGALTADKLRATALEIKREKVHLPEFGNGDYVWIHGMTAFEKTQHDAEAMDDKWSGIVASKMMTTKERMVLKCMKDDDGARILGDSDEEVELLQNWPSDVLNRLFDVANRLSGGTTDGKK